MRTQTPNQTLIVEPSSSQVSVLPSAPAPLKGRVTWRLISDADGTAMIPESPDQIVSFDDGQDPALVRYQRPYVAPAFAGQYLAIWRYQMQEVADTILVASPAGSGTARAAAFATSSDVQARLGRALTVEETANVPFLLNMAAAVIADAVGYDDGWAVKLTDPPQLLRLLSVQLVCRGLANPSQYSDIRQQVGSYSFQATWDHNSGMLLSDAEVLMVRRAVHGRTTDSPQIDSGLQRAQDEYWLRKQAAGYGSSESANVIA